MSQGLFHGVKSNYHQNTAPKVMRKQDVLLSLQQIRIKPRFWHSGLSLRKREKERERREREGEREKRERSNK